MPGNEPIRSEPNIRQSTEGYEKRKAQHGCHQIADGRSLDIEMGQHEQRNDRARHAAGRKPSNHHPFDPAGQPMNQAAASFGSRRIKQIGAHRGRWRDAEQQNEQRRHQRAAPHSCHPHKQAADKPEGRVQRIEGREIHGHRLAWSRAFTVTFHGKHPTSRSNFTASRITFV
jgi:hypothetical protein